MKYGICGLDCTQCGIFQEKKCKGCHAMKGNSFFGHCKWYKCCKDKGYEHCGHCDTFPCVELKSALEEVGGLSAIDNLKPLK